LDQIDDGDEIQAYLGTKTGQRTVPNVFIEQKHIGGNSDVQKIKNGGTLKELLVHAGAATS
jgi:glutaredoxin 3